MCTVGGNARSITPIEGQVNTHMSSKIQLSLRVSEKFYEQIQAEGIARDLSIQDMLEAGLKLLFSGPKHWDYVAQQFVTLDSKANRQEIARRLAWTRLWQRYMSEMPDVKTKQIAEVMKLDLLYYGSSRRKKPRRQPGEGGRLK